MKLRVPHIFNLRRDPFERADFNSNTYWDWMVDHVPQLYLVQALVAEQIENFVKYPPRQKPASFNLDAVMRAIRAGDQGGKRGRGCRASEERTRTSREVENDAVEREVLRSVPFDEIA